MGAWRSGTYYVANNETGRVVDGPFHSSGEAAKIVDAQDNPPDFGTYSRYMLDKSGFYPRTKAGDKRLKDDLIAARLGPVVDALIDGGARVGGALAIIEERLRQITEEGYGNIHDNKHGSGELAMAAAHYAMPPSVARTYWPWRPSQDKKNKHNRRRQLVIAGALVAAEIDRLDRMGEDEARG